MSLRVSASSEASTDRQVGSLVTKVIVYSIVLKSDKRQSSYAFCQSSALTPKVRKKGISKAVVGPQYDIISNEPPARVFSTTFTSGED